MTEEISVNFVCDGPSCTEESLTGENWLTVIVRSAIDINLENKYMNKHFHDETCLTAYVEA